MRLSSYKVGTACGVFLLIVSGTAALFGGPQHWGFGFGYLVAVEEDAQGRRVLSVYEPPLRVKDGPWLLRWRDASGQYADVLPDGVVVGDFWPQAMGGKEYVLLLTSTPEAGLRLVALDPPEVFGTRPWKPAGEWRSTPLAEDDPQRRFGDKFLPPLAQVVGGNRILAVAAGNLANLKRDHLIVLTADSRQPPNYALQIYAPPEEPGGADWTIWAMVPLKSLLSGPEDRPLALAAADFWGTGKDVLLLMLPGRAVYFELKGTGTRTPAAQPGKGRRGADFTIARPNVVAQVPLERGWTPGDWVAAADFLKDGFAYVALGTGGADQVRFTTAPAREERFNTCWVRPDETFAGAKLAGQKPGEVRHIMTGVRQAAAGRVIAAGAGRIFGYIVAGVDERKEKLWKPWTFAGRNDVEISFAHRTPVYLLGVPKEWQDGDWPWEPDDHFGWPHKDEEVTYEVNIKNNGREAIPAGRVTLRAWINTPDRNADTLAADRRPADFSFTIEESIPPFDPAKPEYTVVPVKIRWPFVLVQPEGWTWKKLNVRDVGERWLIVRVEYAGDENERNDRYELALNSLLFRPVLRFDVDAPPHPTPEGLEGKPERTINTLAYRAPVVLGDPESKEYYGRKLADAVQCMWERSRTSDGQDVWQRVAFDSYRLYDPQGRGGLKPLNRADDWSYYEGPRENEHWLGLWGDYERFDPRAGGAELHETGHLFHRIGDLYHYFIFPTGQRDIRLADGDPVQMYTYAWGLDSFCSGHAIIGEATCDLHRYLEGVRYGLGFAWHKLLPAKINVRVLDRDGQPVPDAKVSCWTYPPRHSGDPKKSHEPFSAGTTDAGGLWDPGINKKPGRTFAPFNLPQYDDPVLDSIAQVFTVELPGYSDFMIWGAEDPHAHSRYTLMHRTILDGAAWTWDFKTLYKPGAPAADFAVQAAVRGREVSLRIAGPAQKYRVYRRWEPTYTFERVAEVTAGAASPDAPGTPFATFTDNMAAADWYMQGRYRAAYYVTKVMPDGAESLPKRVYGIGLEKVHGVSDLGEGRLVATVNCGKAEPFGVLCDGTTPAEELIKHFRFGHAAAKIVGSRKHAGQRYYATLVASDMPWGADRFFDLIQFDKPDRHNALYAVVQTIAECDVTEFSSPAGVTPTAADAPRLLTAVAGAAQTVTVRPDPDARAATNPGDWALAGDARARILAVDESDTKLTLDKPLFKDGQEDSLHVRIEFGGGTPGDNAGLRELRGPRGLAVIQAEDGREYIAIADTGNGRIVVWDSGTKHVAAWKPAAATAFTPVAVAADPQRPGWFFVLERSAAGPATLHRLVFDGRAVAETPDFPFEVATGQAAAETEMGLAVALADGRPIAAITDATNKRVLEIAPYGVYRRGDQPDTVKRYDVISTRTGLLAPFVGDAKLTNPTDVSYTIQDGALQLYCADGHNRIVRLR